MTNETIQEKLYSKLKLLKEKAEQDCFFDRKDIDSSFNNTNSIIYWINTKMEWIKVYRDFDKQRKEKYRTTYEFYQTEYPLKINTKEEYQLFIESDPGYQPIFMICQTCKEVIQYIDSVIDTLKSRSFEINNAIKWELFKNGQ